MSDFSRYILVALNVAILIFGVYHIYFARDVSDRSAVNPCLRPSAATVQAAGVVGVVVAAIGIVGSCFRLRALQSVYLWAVLMWTAAAAAFCVFIWAMMPWTTAEVTYYKIAERGVWLAEYRPALRKVVANDKDMFAVKTCFKEIDTCRTMANQTETQKDVFIDFGCCSPPTRCGMLQDDTGRWAAASNGLNSTDDECQLWARVGRNCFNCDSCEAGYLASFQSRWDKSVILRSVCMLVLIATSALTYYVFINDHYTGNNKNKNPKNGKLVGSHV
ncbi:tetraspanin-3 [Striga asiatica]|uniref:Tetraspanin-3 n=1 Tax=Striga asiatica TaxID=4170 RepID=A0A5A7QQE7_STRAF|nr:tetraspanin-3 [Striga asiatica]